MTTLISDDVVMLRHLSIADIDGNYGQWFNDPNIVKNNSHGRFPMTRENLEQYVATSSANRSMIVLAVVLRESEIHVGNISLQNINWIDRNAEIAFILGEIAHQGKGVMFRAGSLLIQHAFNQLNLHRVYCGTLDTNIGMKKLAVKFGMQEEGRRRDAIYKNGEYVDIVEFGILNARGDNV